MVGERNMLSHHKIAFKVVAQALLREKRKPMYLCGCQVLL